MNKTSPLTTEELKAFRMAFKNYSGYIISNARGVTHVGKIRIDLSKTLNEIKKMGGMPMMSPDLLVAKTKAAEQLSQVLSDIEFELETIEDPRILFHIKTLEVEKEYKEKMLLDLEKDLLEKNPSLSGIIGNTIEEVIRQIKSLGIMILLMNK